METEGVVHALRRASEAVVPGGLVIETHSVPPAGPVVADGAVLGRLDLDEFFAGVAAMEREVERALEQRLLRLRRTLQLTIHERFATGDDFVADASGWAGTRVPPALERAARSTSGEVVVAHNLALRSFRTYTREP